MILPICRFHHRVEPEGTCFLQTETSFTLPPIISVFVLLPLFGRFFYELKAIISGSFSTSQVLVGKTLTIKEHGLTSNGIKIISHNNRRFL